MKGVVRSHDLLARFGGDEFVVLLEDVAGVDVAVAAARRICAAVEQPMVLPDGYELVASVSVGIALTEPGKTADDVLRNADVAMYDAKAKGGGGIYKVFDQASMGTRSSERLQIEADLRKGLERDELEVHYQPFYSLDEQRIVGAEALVRWRHPTNGLISPMRFIPMAEETGLILPLGRYVLDKACQQVRSIRDRLGVDLPISVNLSPRQFQESGLLSQVAAALDATGLPSELLMFEITETMVMEDLSGAREVMKKLNRLGVRLAIDDFGTGHSSLGVPQAVPGARGEGGPRLRPGRRREPGGLGDRPGRHRPGQRHGHIGGGRGRGDQGPGRRAEDARLPGWRRASTSRSRFAPRSSTSFCSRHFAPSAGPSRTALTGEGATAPGITTLSPVLACTSDAVRLPG